MKNRSPLLRVLAVARRQLVWLGLALVAMVVVAAATLFVYNLVRPIYDQLLAPGSTAAQAPPGQLVLTLDRLTSSLSSSLGGLVGGGRRALLVLVLLGIVLKNLFAFMAKLCAARFGLATIRDLRLLLFDAYLGQSPAYFRRHPTGEVMSRVIHDVEQIREALGERLGDLVQDVLTVLALLAYVLALEPRLALMTLVVAPVLLAPVVVLSRWLRRRARESQQSMGELGSVLDESVRGIQVVLAFAMQGPQRRRFLARVQRHYRARLQARAIQAANAPIMEVVGALAAVVLISFASAQIAAGQMTLGDFSAFLVGVWGAYNPLKRLNKFNLVVQQAAVAGGRIFEVVDSPDSVPEARRPVEELDRSRGVALEKVWFAYESEDWILRGIDLHLAAGETVALVGASGAGKTTVAQLIPRFWDVARGRVLVGGVDVRELARTTLRAQLGLVTQHTMLFDQSVVANIAAGQKDAERARVEAAARAAQAHDFICELPQGYDTRLGEAGVRLSGGQRQRIAIARALFKDPPYLIFDEATSALDAEVERQLGVALRELVANRTTLLIAHRLSTLHLADRIAVLQGGRIVQEGSHDELHAVAGPYRRMVEAGSLDADGR